MGKIFTLTPAIKAVIKDVLDDMQTELGKACRLVYPPRWDPCDNCVWDQTNDTSGNVWITGGPIQFDQGTTCPLCGGQGKKAVEVTEDITLLCNWEPKSFWVPVPGVQLRAPFSILQTKGYMTDLPKVLNADHLIFQTAIEGMLRKRYKLLGQPGDRSNLIQGRYFVATWEQI